MKDWIQKKAKRIIAEATLREAIKVIEETKGIGGSAMSSPTLWKTAGHLARHAAEQLRISEE